MNIQNNCSATKGVQNKCCRLHKKWHDDIERLTEKKTGKLREWPAFKSADTEKKKTIWIKCYNQFDQKEQWVSLAYNYVEPHTYSSLISIV